VLANKTVVAVAEGYLHSLALCADGTLAAWGYNLFGQLGNNSAAPSSEAVAVDRTGALAGKTVVAIAAGPFHNLALCADGTVVAWGNNNYGQLGDGTTATKRVPVRVSPVGALAGKQVVAVAAAAYSSFALCDDGTVAAWGYNDEGELGNSGSTTSLVPVAVTTTGALSGKRVASLAAGQYHTLALCTDGTLVSWGYNNRGQLGNNSTTSSSQPVAIGSFGALAGKIPVGISTGAYHSLARCTDGTVAAWGANNLGQLGVAGTVPSAVPVAVSLAVASQIAAGGSHSMALGADGTLFAWGDNSDGQLGDNSIISRAVPAAVDFAAISTGTRVMGMAGSSAARHNLALVALAVPTGKAVRQTNAAIAAAAAGDDLLNMAFGLNAGQFPQPQRVGDNFVIHFTQPDEAAGIRYGAEWSATLLPGSWEDVPDTGVDGEHCFSLPAGGQPRGFMRLKVTRE
jgi:alpha-tubulin suppressor-like RCC1 family protein